MEKTKVLVLMLTLITLLTGCSDNASTELSQNIAADTTFSQKEMTSQNDKNNILIAYFPESGILIQKVIGGDIHFLGFPKKEYFLIVYSVDMDAE